MILDEMSDSHLKAFRERMGFDNWPSVAIHHLDF